MASLASSLELFDLEFWWELAALITIMLLGHWQEMKAIGQAQGALAALAELLPDDAERVERRRIASTAVPLDELRPGDVVLVRSGARVPADGEIVEGAAELDESMITGESRPVPKQVGERVVAGTVSTDSAIRVRVTAVGEDTALAGIQRLVAAAQAVAAERRCWPTGLLRSLLRGHRCRRASRSWRGGARRSGRRRRAHCDGAGDRLSARARSRHPTGDLDLDRGGGRRRASW